jgi:hypothetical protein
MYKWVQTTLPNTIITSKCKQRLLALDCVFNWSVLTSASGPPPPWMQGLAFAWGSSLARAGTGLTSRQCGNKMEKVEWSEHRHGQIHMIPRILVEDTGVVASLEKWGQIERKLEWERVTAQVTWLLHDRIRMLTSCLEPTWKTPLSHRFPQTSAIGTVYGSLPTTMLVTKTRRWSHSTQGETQGWQQSSPMVVQHILKNRSWVFWQTFWHGPIGMSWISKSHVAPWHINSLTWRRGNIGIYISLQRNNRSKKITQSVFTIFSPKDGVLTPKI